MAKGIRELRGRIRSVKNIAQITRAMEMVASTRLRRLQERAEGAIPYSLALRSLVGHLSTKVSPEEYPLLQRNESGAVGILSVSSDKGLCGAYNSNVFREIQDFVLAREGEEFEHFVFGRKGAAYFKERPPAWTESYSEVMERITFVQASEHVKEITQRYLAGELREVHLISTRFLSASRQKPEVLQLLPIDAEVLLTPDERANPVKGDPLLEPSPEAIFGSLLPKYLEVQVYEAILEALASEFAMRRAAMKAATDAANDMMGELTRDYNRARQETITNELLEIVGGAEALKG